MVKFQSPSLSDWNIERFGRVSVDSFLSSSPSLSPSYLVNIFPNPLSIISSGCLAKYHISIHTSSPSETRSSPYLPSSSSSPFAFSPPPTVTVSLTDLHSQTILSSEELDLQFHPVGGYEEYQLSYRVPPVDHEIHILVNAIEAQNSPHLAQLKPFEVQQFKFSP